MFYCCEGDYETICLHRALGESIIVTGVSYVILIIRSMDGGWMEGGREVNQRSVTDQFGWPFLFWLIHNQTSEQQWSVTGNWRTDQMRTIKRNMYYEREKKRNVYLRNHKCRILTWLNMILETFQTVEIEIYTLMSLTIKISPSLVSILHSIRVKMSLSINIFLLIIRDWWDDTRWLNAVWRGYISRT